MKKIKILGIETHWKTNGDKIVTSGVDFARIVQPLQELAKNPDFEVKIVKDPFKDNNETWDTLTKYYDIIYTSYIDSPEGYINMKVNADKNNCKIVVDIDDNLHEIPPASPVYETYHIGSFPLDVVSKIIEDAEYVTTTNSFLKYDIKKWYGRDLNTTQVLPNFIDFKRYDKSKIKEKTNDKIVIGFFGSNTHVVDIMMPEYINAIERLCKEFPNVEYRTIGLFLPHIKSKLGRQYSFTLGQADVFSWASELWPKMMSECDIFTAPLLNTNFSKCKSNIKLLEIGAGSKPAVFSDIRQYRELIHNGDNGYLAADQYDWYRYLKELILSEENRKSIGESLYNTVRDNHQMKDGVKLYADYFKSILIDKL